MRRKNENVRGFLILLVVAIFVVVVILILIQVWNGFYLREARTFFGISNANTLSAEEKMAIEPMVNKTLAVLEQKVISAESKRMVFLNRKNEITTEDADQFLADLRAAQEEAREALHVLMRACNTARYFSLSADYPEWCE